MPARLDTQRLDDIGDVIGAGERLPVCLLWLRGLQLNLEACRVAAPGIGLKAAYGAKVTEVFPVLALADGVGLALGAMTLGRSLSFGIMANPALYPVALLAAGVHAAFTSSPRARTLACRARIPGRWSVTTARSARMEKRCDGLGTRRSAGGCGPKVDHDASDLRSHRVAKSTAELPR